MPFIITTRRPVGVSKSLAPACKVCRVAVAALEEAQAEQDRILATHGRRGGLLSERFEKVTVGPLPDGGLIEVEQIDWKSLALRAGLLVSNHMGQEQILAAFNALAIGTWV